MPAAPGDQQLPRPQEVFISYSRKDKEFLRRLHEALSQHDRLGGLGRHSADRGLHAGHLRRNR